MTRDAIAVSVWVDGPRRTSYEAILDAIDAARPSWHAQAACNDGTGHNVKLFYPDGWAGRRTTHTRALAICDGCTVRRQCAEQGAHEPAGTWGGVVRDKTKSSGRTTLALLRRDGGWWTAARIANARQVTERTVYRQLSGLRADGLVEVQIQPNHRPNLYRARKP